MAGINFDAVKDNDKVTNYNFVSDNEKEGTIDKVEEKNFFDSLVSIPGAIVSAVTGEGQEVEFPNVPEATDMGSEAPGLIEGIVPNIKSFLARDDVGKLEIFEDAFKGDERWGGAFQDKFGNPMMIWNDKPYYVNKPGFSGQDFGTFVGEIIKFIPAAKIMKKAKNIKQTIGLGVPTYGATEAGSQVLESAMTPKTTKEKDKDLSDLGKEVGTVTAIGVGADLALPPIVKGATKVASKVSKPIAKVFPRFNPGSLGGSQTQTSQFPLTTGQRESPLPDLRAGPTPKGTPQLEEEDVLRRAAGTNKEASFVIRGFDEQQLDQIKAEAQALQTEFGSGSPLTTLDQVDVPGVAAEGIKEIGEGTAQSLKKEASTAYTDVRNAVNAPRMTREGLRTSVGNALAAVRKELGITNRELDRMPILKGELEYLKKVFEMTSKPNMRGASLNQIHGYQKSLNRAFRTAEPGSPEALALGEIKNVIDNSVFRGVQEGFMYGDEVVLDQLSKANQLYKDYIGLTGKAKGKDGAERAANLILQKITNPNYTPRQVANALFGHNKFAPNQAVPLVIDKLKATLPEDQFNQVIGLLKDSILEKAFSGAGKSGVTRTNIVNNYNDIFVKQKAITDKLFNEEEIAKISKFRENVMPTLWAELKMNPSNSGYTLLSAMTRSGIMNFTRGLPVVGAEIVGAVEGAQQRSMASNAIRQYITRTQAPLFSQGFQASIRPTVVETMSEVESSPSLENILEGLSPEDRDELLEQVNTE